MLHHGLLVEVRNIDAVITKTTEYDEQDAEEDTIQGTFDVEAIGASVPGDFARDSIMQRYSQRLFVPISDQYATNALMKLKRQRNLSKAAVDNISAITDERRKVINEFFKLAHGTKRCVNCGA